jgi:iron complex transport system substrate-binding protein
MGSGPRRIVCLSAETADVLYRLGAGDLVVGVSGYTTVPREARRKPIVSAFTTIRYEAIEALQPDLILGFSDLQAEALRVLGERGYPVLLTNQRTLQETFDTIVTIGRIVGRGPEAEALVASLQKDLDRVREASRGWTRRPRVFFEEWDDPLITGISWVGELIEAAGGVDVFPEIRPLRTAPQRVLRPEAVVESAPDIIIASWCGRKVRMEAIRSRPGWQGIPAVRHGRIYEVKSAYCLQPGPVLISEGLPRFHAIFRSFMESAAGAEPG